MNNRQVFDADTVERWFAQGVFFDPAHGRNYISENALKILIAKVNANSFVFWASENFNQDVPPESVHLGITLCSKCGRIYWVTPKDDSYSPHESQALGNLCERCLFASAIDTS